MGKWENGFQSRKNIFRNLDYSDFWIYICSGPAGRKRNRGRLLSRQFGEIGSQNRIVHIVDRSVLGFCVYALAKSNHSKN